MKTNIYFSSYLAQFFLELEMFQSCRENQYTHFMTNFFFSKILLFMRQCGNIP